MLRGIHYYYYYSNNNSNNNSSNNNGIKAQALDASRKLSRRGEAAFAEEQLPLLMSDEAGVAA